MAKIEGTIYGTTSNPKIDVKIYYTSVLYNGESVVTANLYYKRNDSGYTTSGTGTFYIYMDGVQVKKSSTAMTIGTSWVQAAFVILYHVPHNDDGTKTVTISASGSIPGTTLESTSISGTFKLETIPRESTITSASNKTLGNACSITWTPLAKSLRYRLQFTLGDWSYTSDPIHPNTTSLYTYTDYTLPLAVANQLPTAKTGTMTVTLYTYSDSEAKTQIGSSSSKTFTVTVPDNESTKPTVTIGLAPAHSLGEAFKSVYLQGKSKVQATLSASGKYGATIDESSCKMSVLGYTDLSSPYQSGYLTTAGTVEVTGYATDSRGFTGTKKQSITVTPYSKPKIIPANGERTVICARCDKNGNLDESGTYLMIKAKREYSKVGSLNLCAIRYRCKPATNANFTDSDWVTILTKNSTGDEVTTTPIANLVTDTSISYIVEVGVIDDVGESSSLKITVPTSLVDFHLREGGGGAAFGKYAERNKCLDIASDWDVTGRVYGLGKSKANIPEDGDLNSYTEFGVYSIALDTHATTIKNCPVARAGILIVSSAIGDGNSNGKWAYISQKYISIDGKHELHRLITTSEIAGDYTYGEWLRQGNTNWRELKLSSSVSSSDKEIGRHPNEGCWYRVVNENHIYVAFNCAFAYKGSEIQVNLNALPEEYRPKRLVYAMCPINGRGIARIIVRSYDGNIIVDYVQNMESSVATTSYEVTWIDGYIDYWV